MGIVEELGTIAMVTQALRTGPALVELKHPLKKKKSILALAGLIQWFQWLDRGPVG